MIKLQNYETNNKQQTTNNKQQTTNNKQQIKPINGILNVAQNYIKHKYKLICLVVASTLIISGLLAYSKFYNELVLVKAQSTPTLTVSVEKYTQNHLPNITGNCVVGDNLLFTIKKGNTGVVSETMARTCTVSPYSLTPTISLPDGKYKVSVSKVIGGCAINNTIEGTMGDDIIAGTPANDLINGNAGNDILNGGPGCDTIYAVNAGNLIGDFALMYGDGGDDTLYGGEYYDLDTATENGIEGVRAGLNAFFGSNDVLRGVGEKDLLVGTTTALSFIGSSTDYFVLGNDQGSYYLGGGDSDYAEIRNFECGRNDTIQLGGTSGEYTIAYSGNVASVYHLQANGSQDLIAKVNGFSSGLDLNNGCFSYITV